jgi:hypothetical protein
VLLVPRPALALMRQGLTRYRDGKLEGCCFWYGPKVDSRRLPISHVVFPKQVNERKSFAITSEAIAEMSAATRPLGILNRAQLHTHPSSWVEHSWYDDDHAISRKAISIVLPYYGNTIEKWPQGIGVNEFRDGQWKLLTGDQASQQVQIVEATIELIDLR